MSGDTKIQVAFRVDASIEIGAGHVMRCLTLADALRKSDARCYFICRELDGNLIELIQQHDYEVQVLPDVGVNDAYGAATDIYARWLGVQWQVDAEGTINALMFIGIPNWLVVDHYALDKKWEGMIRSYCKGILVIDDLANRCHEADILLDQTLGRVPADYIGLIRPECDLFCGIENVLLRPEFDEWREYSLARRSYAQLKRILVSLGGVDKDNISSDVLLAINAIKFTYDMEVCLILGKSSRWITEVRELVENLSFKVDLRVAANNMAELLANCDLAIGAAGTSAWERCYLGVPTLMLVLADNQREIGANLDAAGAAQLLKGGTGLNNELIMAIKDIMANPGCLLDMSQKAAALIPCSGAGKIASLMVERQI